MDPSFSLIAQLSYLESAYNLTPGDLFDIVYTLCKARPDLRHLL